jgi:hypothetical protein
MVVAGGTPVGLELDFRSTAISKRESGFATERLLGKDMIISPSECTSARVRGLYEYWEKARGDRAMPRRADIDPIEIWTLLPYVHMSEWHPESRNVYFRIAGTEIVATAGREYRGRWLDEMLSTPDDRDQIMSLYVRVVATRVPIFGRTGNSSSRLGVDFFEWILCPLSEDGKNVTHFLGLEDYVSHRRYLGSAAQ